MTTRSGKKYQAEIAEDLLKLLKQILEEGRKVDEKTEGERLRREEPEEERGTREEERRWDEEQRREEQCIMRENTEALVTKGWQQEEAAKLLVAGKEIVLKKVLEKDDIEPI